MADPEISDFQKRLVLWPCTALWPVRHNGVVQVASLRFSEIPPEEWVPGGIKILTYETKIAEMKLSEPSKNDFQFLEKNIQPKLKFLRGKSAKIWKSRNFPDLADPSTPHGSLRMRVLCKILKKCNILF